MRWKVLLFKIKILIAFRSHHSFLTRGKQVVADLMDSTCMLACIRAFTQTGESKPFLIVLTKNSVSTVKLKL